MHGKLESFFYPQAIIIVIMEADHNPSNEMAFEANGSFEEHGMKDDGGEYSANKKQRFNDFKVKPRYWTKNYPSPVCIINNDNGIALSSTGFLIVVGSILFFLLNIKF